MSCDLWQQKLALYADSELPDEQVAALEAHLRTCTQCAADALGRVQMKRAVRAAGKRYTAPADFRWKIEQSIRPKRSFLRATSWMPNLAVAALALVLIVVGAGLWMRRAEQQRALAEFADLHVTALASANPVDVVSTDRHTVKPWFVGKLPFTFNLPEFAGSPFVLVGGRLAYIDHSPAAHLLFEVRQHRLSLFVLQDRGAALSSNAMQAKEVAFNVQSWSENGLRYVVITDASADDAQQFAEMFRNASGAGQH